MEDSDGLIEEIVQVIRRVRRVHLEPDDVIILEHPEMLSVEQAESLKSYGEREFPGHKVVVLSGDLTLRIGETNGQENVRR